MKQIVFSLLIFSLLVQPVRAGDANASLYESYSPVTHEFYGSFKAGVVPRTPFWYRVTKHADQTQVVVEPEGRIRWVVHHKNGRAEYKQFYVNDKPYSRCSYRHDDQARLIAKEVRFVDAHAHTVRRFMQYEYDSTGALISLKPPKGASGRSWKIEHTKNGSIWTLFDDKNLPMRRDHYNSKGWLLKSEFAKNQELQANKPSLVLIYKLDSQGRIKKVERKFLGKSYPPVRLDRPLAEKYRAYDKARPEVIDDMVDALGKLNDSMSRREVHLAIGLAPRGVFRLQNGIVYAEEMYGCRLNQVSAVVYSPLDMIDHMNMECICGYCFAPDSQVQLDKNKKVAIAKSYPGLSIMVFDPEKKSWTSSKIKELRWHWVYSGIRINDDAIQVTALHQLLTESGPQVAKDLKKGSRVLGVDGKPVEIKSVSHEKLAKPQKWFAVIPDGKTGWHAVSGVVAGLERR
jgi:hypothetical protein